MKALNSFILSGTIVEIAYSHGRGIVTIGTNEYDRDGRTERTYELYLKSVGSTIEHGLYEHICAFGHFEYINEHYREGLPGEVKMVADSIIKNKRLIACALDDDDLETISDTLGCAFESKNLFYVNGTVTSVKAFANNFILVGLRVRTSIGRNRTSLITVATAGRAGQIASTVNEGDEVLFAGVITKQNGRTQSSAFSLFGRDIEILSRAEKKDTDNENPEGDIPADEKAPDTAAAEDPGVEDSEDGDTAQVKEEDPVIVEDAANDDPDPVAEDDGRDEAGEL